MKKLLLVTLAATAISTASYAQFSEFEGNKGASPFTLSNDNNTLQIGGRVSFYYQNRLLKPGHNYTDMSNNGFDVKDCDLDILGKTSSKWTYEFHVSLVDIITAAATGNAAAPTSPGFKAAYLQYRGWKVKVKFGFDKIPFSQSNITHEHESPMFSHPKMTGGDFFSRRDLGVTFNTSFLTADKLCLYAGAYTGMGENFFEYGNDPSGTFEYVGRAEFCYPSKMDHSLMDDENSPILHFRVAANARYENKTQPSGSPSVAIAYPDMVAPYNTRMVDGERTIYGGDAIAKYRGFAATFETDIINMRPHSQSDGLFNGTAGSFNKNVVHAGGFITGLSYTAQKLKSALYVNYERYNWNDLMPGINEWLEVGYAYKVKEYNSCFKIEYYRPLTEDPSYKVLKYDGEVRVGYQVVF